MNKLSVTTALLALTFSGWMQASPPPWAGMPQAREGRNVSEPRSPSQREERRQGAQEGLPAALTPQQRERLLSVVLEEYFGLGADTSPQGPGQAKALPPGLQKRLAQGGSLPPGWQMKLARGEVIDTGLYAGAERLPPHLQRRAGVHTEDAELVIVGDRLVRLMSGQGTILDVIDLAVAGARQF